jgi:hypothetical protein
LDGREFKDSLTNAIRYWEVRRLLYNAVLALVVIVHFVAAMPASRHSINPDMALGVFLLAVVANVAYCAAYIPDVFTQASGYREAWRRLRWIVFTTGTVFAAIITHFLSYGLFISG